MSLNPVASTTNLNALGASHTTRSPPPSDAGRPDPPPLSRSEERRQFSKKDDSTLATIDEIESRSNANSIERSQVKTQGSVELTILLGKSKLSEAQSFWKHLKSAPVPSNIVLHNDKSSIGNSSAPGGSDDMNCSVCWKKFGMMTRKHRCRISRRFICDECSTRRIFDNDEEHRVSDGQFLLAKAEELKNTNKMLGAAKVQEQQRKQLKTQEVKQKQSSGGVAARLEQLEAEENAGRDSLFGGMMATVTKALGESESTKDTSQTESDSLAGLSNQLNQTRDVLNERGEKLSTLSDKSDKLVSASQDFAAMAKELNRKSNQGFFSW